MSAPPLLATKTFIRPVREDLVPRPRLIGRLDDALKRPLTLISAPAGFGKTTLLAEWLANRRHCACWLSLDASDNDRPRFLSYMIAALERVVPGVAGDLVLPLRSSQPPPVEVVIAALANELMLVPDHIVLVLDDYHVITAAAVNDAVTFLLENLPPNLHLAILTRFDPPIPIARLRSRGQVLEIRADELRFTPDEAAAFLNQTMGLALSPEQVAVLEERTEGWVAGLQMAALSMRGRDDLDGFIRAFAGTNRYILDFLVEEVLSREPEGVQSFLLQTAILGRLSGPLCDAVTGVSGGQEMLEQLERRNLFVVPLDDERRWYRYHHLFADLLRARLQRANPDLAPQLHARAAQWCRQEGLIVDAIGHSLAAHNVDQAALLAEEAFLAMWTRSDARFLLSLAELPEAAVRRRPWLCANRAEMLIVTGELAEAEHYVQAAEERMRAEGSVTDDRDLAGYLAVMRACIAEWQGGERRAVETAREALTAIGEGKAALRSSISYWLAETLLLRGDLEAAEEAWAELARRDRESGVTNTVSPAMARLLRLQVVRGRLREAARLCNEWLRWMEGKARWRYYLSGNVLLALARVLQQWNSLEAAAARAREGIEENRVWENPNASAAGYCTLARVLVSQGDLDGADHALWELDQLIRGHSLAPDVRSELVACRVILALARDDLALANAVAAESGLGGDLPCDFRHEKDRLTLARLLIARGQFDHALSLLAQQERQAREGGRLGRVIEILVLRAKALGAGGGRTHEPALAALAEALGLAEPEDQIRVFVDEGEPIAGMLASLQQHSPSPAGGGRFSLGYVTRLLAAFKTPPLKPSAQATAPATPAGTPGDPPSGPLVEQLSARELEVARLMAEGLTNDQIAATLFIALGTVKAHVHNISGKLGARNRAHAVALAKELGIL